MDLYIVGEIAQTLTFLALVLNQWLLYKRIDLVGKLCLDLLEIVGKMAKGE